MRRKFYWEWQKLDEETYRVMVPGGWLVLHQDSKMKTECMSFVPDRDQEWLIVQRPVDAARPSPESKL